MDNIDATENSASIGQPQVDAQLGVRVHTHATLGSHTIVFQNDLTPVTRRDFGILQEQILVKVAASVKEVIQNELRQSPFPPIPARTAHAPDRRVVPAREMPC